MSEAHTAGKDEPEWINEELIQDALHVDDQAVQVKTISISRATAPGDNYCSVLYRVTATLHDGEDRSLLVKASPEGEGFADAVMKSGIFGIETTMLADVIPAMQALLQRASPTYCPPIAARCLMHGKTPAPFLVLEDLKPLGFRLAQRQRGLGLRHGLMAIRALARYHAATAALLEKDPSIGNGFVNPISEEDTTWDPFITCSFQMAADVCKKWPGYEEYAECLEQLKPKGKEFLAKLNNPLPGRFKVIIHGDFWTNNMMFQYDDDDDGKLKGFRMVDFQISHVASPVVDIQYFLNTSLSDEVSRNHEALLLREYYLSLTETLQQLGTQGPSFDELKQDMDTCGVLGVYSTVAVWPIARAEKTPDLDAQAVGDSAGSFAMYDNELTKRWFHYILPEYKRRGWLKYESVF